MPIFSEVVQGPGATTGAYGNKVALPNMTLPSTARMITKIRVTAALVNFNVAEPLVGYIEVTSENCGISPFHIPLEVVPGFITVAASVQREAHDWICNCPCPGGTILKFNHIADVTLGIAPEIQVAVEFTEGESPYPGGQLHMKSAEPAVALGTADNVAVSLNNITIKASHLHMVWGYAIQTQPTADECCPSTTEITCDTFGQSGPFRFAWNPHGAGIANSASGGVDLTTIVTDRSFKSPGTDQVVKCVTTTRDAMAGDGISNWGVVYS